MNSMKALFRVTFPKIKDQTEAERTFNTTNNQRLNDNFQSIFDKIYEHEEAITAISNYVVSEGLSGAWFYRVWDDGTAEAWLASATITEVISTADGSLYRSEESVTMPSGVFANIDCVNVTVEGASVVFASVKAVSVTSLDLYLVAGASASYDLKIHAHIVGRV